MKRNYPIIKNLIDGSQKYRLELFGMWIDSRRPHIPSTFGLVEIVNSLFNGEFTNFDINDENRDRLIISPGHEGIVMYPFLADKNYISKEELKKFTQHDGILRQYPDPSMPLVECPTGSLSHGLGIGGGMAERRKNNVYVIISDGEFWEGSTQEAMSLATRRKLRNLICIMNNNGTSILGETKTAHEPLEEKWKSYNWFTQRVNGHSYTELLSAFDNIMSRIPSDENYHKPSVIIADTLKGKGIKEIEGDPMWHSRIPNNEQEKKFREELNKFNYITN